MQGNFTNGLAQVEGKKGNEGFNVKKANLCPLGLSSVQKALITACRGNLK